MKKLLLLSLLFIAQICFAQVDESIKTFKGHKREVYKVSFVANSNEIISYSQDSTIKFWDKDTGLKSTIVRPNAATANYSPGKKYFQTYHSVSGIETTIEISDGVSGKLIKTLPKDFNGWANFSPDNKYLVVATLESILDEKKVNRIQIWDLSSGVCVQTFNSPHSDLITDISFSPNGKTFATSSFDSKIALWDINSKGQYKILTDNPDWAIFSSFSPDGKRLVTCYIDSSVSVFNIITQKVTQRLKGHTNSVRMALYSPDGSVIATCSDDKSIKLFDAYTGQCIKTLTGHTGPVKSISFSTDGNYLVSGSEDKTLKLWDISKYYPERDITAILKQYVEDGILAWQTKGEFEKSIDFQNRVNEANRKRKVDEYTKLCIDSLKNVEKKKLDNQKFVLNQYDADNETYLIENGKLGQYALPVPMADGPAVKANWANAKIIKPDFYLDNNQFKLSKFSVLVNGKTYTYDSKIPSTYTTSNITYNFEPIEVTIPQDNVVKAPATITTGQTISVGIADVDTNIPTSSTTNDKTYVVIIANENYQRESKVDFAVNDGKVFKSYCEKTLGIPSANIHFVENATYGNLLAEKDWLSNVLEAGNGSVKGIFYYAGHGIPNEQTKSAYLLPVDGNSTSTATALSLDDLYNSLGEQPSKGVTVFLDACFSGSTRDNGTLASARSGKLKPRESTLNGNLVVFSAATGDETAWPYRDKQHGLFTYYLLKKMQETKGDVTYKDLIGYLTEKVKFESVTKNSKSQTPTVNYSHSVNPVWENWKLK